MTHLEQLELLKIDFPKLNELNPSSCTERSIKIHYPDFHSYVLENTIDTKWTERLYMVYHNIYERPKCPVCGNHCKFTNIKHGYSTYCSNKCVSKSDDVKRKKEQKSIERWGVKNPMQSKEVKDKIKQTCLEKYGVENVYQSKEVKDKIKQTCLEKYGVESHLQNPDIRNKIKQTCLEKYGVEFVSQSNEFKEICRNNSLEKYGVTHPMKSEIVKQSVHKTHKEKYGVEFISQRPEVAKKTAESLRKNHMIKDPAIIGFTENYEKIICCPHPDCNKCKEKYFITPGGIYYDRKRIGAEVCTRLLPIKSLISSFELKIRDLLDKNNIEYVANARNIISKELDIYVPSKNIAIEFNGIYWHNDKNKPVNYHIDKFNACKEKGIQLITIWEDQYVNDPDIVESIILSKLGIYDNIIYGRKCKIEKVSSNVASDFYSHNHIQGKCGAKFHYALIYDNDVVAMMSFGKRSIGKNIDAWELIRYCSKINTLVIGGVSRLFNNFIKDNNPDKIISWSSNDISNGSMYKMLGFDYINNSKSYWYISISSLKRHHRSGFSKANLIKKGIISSDDTRTESQIMNELNKHFKIWDSGQTKWIWKNIYK